MDLGSLRALALELNCAAHGVAATVTRPAPDDTPITTRVIWLTFIAEESPSGDFRRIEPSRVMAVSLADVPTCPRKTVIVAPEKAGDADRNWIVDGTERIESDHVRVVVLPLLDVEH